MQSVRPRARREGGSAAQPLKVSGVDGETVVRATSGPERAGPSGNVPRWALIPRKAPMGPALDDGDGSPTARRVLTFRLEPELPPW